MTQKPGSLATLRLQGAKYFTTTRLRYGGILSDDFVTNLYSENFEYQSACIEVTGKSGTFFSPELLVSRLFAPPYVACITHRVRNVIKQK